MAEVLCVYREVALLKQAKAKTGEAKTAKAKTGEAKSGEALSGEAETGEAETPDVAIVSYDEKPGIQAISTTTDDLPPVPNMSIRA